MLRIFAIAVAAAALVFAGCAVTQPIQDAGLVPLPEGDEG